ncbi:MAG: glycosyltransferase family 4 protein [Rhodobacteraceae bacterium]|nr:glycosyltransferase family 4 protein [Paracoccaceae bacterium]
MHIAIDASAWDNDRGFGRFTRSLVAALAARDTGFRYTLLCDRAPDRPVPEGVGLVVAGASRSMAAASSGKAARAGADMLTMSRAAAGLGADLFFFPASYSYFPVFARVPVLTCIHDTIPERFPDLVFPTRRNFLFWRIKTWMAKRQSRRIMTVSDASARDLTALLKIPAGRIDVITEGADATFHQITDKPALTAIRTRHGLAPQDRVLTYIGGFNRHKNVLRLIEAMPAILAACPDARLVIVGRVTGERFWDNVDELKAGATRDARMSDRITFAGEIPDDDMAGLLNVSDALVFPSLMEGFGLPALEAMYCGTPVLASDRGSLPEVVGDAGLYYDPEDPDALAAATIRLLSDPGLRRDLAEKARRRAPMFTWDKAAELAEASFRRTLGQR